MQSPGESTLVGPLKMHVEMETWRLVAPFRISGYEFTSIDSLVVTLECRGVVGRGEAAGVHYRGDTPVVMSRQLEQVRPVVEAGLSRDALQRLLPLGGARNALDCALWDLESKLSGRCAWEIANLDCPRPLLTTLTCSAASPESMARTALGHASARAIKLKLLGDQLDSARVQAVREAKPNVWLGVDANQGFTPASLERLLPVLVDMRVELIEQPFPRGEDALLDGLSSPIPIAADESVQGLADLARQVDRVDIINIKLDKCGGLTEALAMARAARDLGFDTMIGNMSGTSLAMAPAYLAGQLCRIVDLDGPIFLERDRDIHVDYTDGYVSCPSGVWGYPNEGH